MIPARLEPIMVLGVADQVLRALERGFPHVRFLVTGREISMTGVQADIDLAANLVEELIGLAGRGQALDADAVEQAISLLGRVTRGEAPSEEILSARGRSIRPKTPGQKAYTDAIDRSTVVFGIGPAGTGKTYLAMAQAVRRLLSGQARRIVLTRPAVEAGENLGFLPGSLIILDEAQNTTLGQMKMFLTRLGFGSKVVVTGDASQVDLPGGQPSGLAVIQTILEDVDGIEFCHLTSADVVRHELVGHIIDAYQRWEDGAARRRSARSRARHPREDRS